MSMLWNGFYWLRDKDGPTVHHLNAVGDYRPLCNKRINASGTRESDEDLPICSVCQKEAKF